MLTTRITKQLNVRHPVILAGMAGGPTTPELVAAVSNAGGVGTLGAGYMTPEKLRDAIHAIRRQTSAPFAVNVFVPEVVQVNASDIQQMGDHLEQFYNVLGVEQMPTATVGNSAFVNQMEVILEEAVPIVSFTFGILPEEWMKILKEKGIIVVGTATTVSEAVMLEEAGVDMIVAQGSEAGGHRGSFEEKMPEKFPLVGTMALIPQVVDSVTIPVVAAGGIMDGRGLAAALMLGADAVQMGTAFLTCREAGTNPSHQKAILQATEADTEVTMTYSGKPARGIRTAFMEQMKGYAGTIPPYPLQNQLTQPLRAVAGKQGNVDYMSLWAGQGIRLATECTAEEIVRETVEEAESRISCIVL